MSDTLDIAKKCGAKMFDDDTFDSQTNQKYILRLHQLQAFRDECEKDLRAQLAEKDRKLAKQQAFISRTGSTRANSIGSEELSALIAQAEQRGIAEMQKKYSEMKPVAWIHDLDGENETVHTERYTWTPCIFRPPKPTEGETK